MLHLKLQPLGSGGLGAQGVGGVALAIGVQVGELLIFRILGSGGQLLVESLAVGLGQVLHDDVGRGHEGIDGGILAGGQGIDGDDAALLAHVFILVLLPVCLDFLLRSGGGGGQAVLGEPCGLAAHLLVHHVHQLAVVLVLELQTLGHQVAQGFPDHHVGNHAAECLLLLVVGGTVAEARQALVELLVEAAILLLEHGHGLQVGVNLLLGGGDAQLLGLSLDDRSVHGGVHGAVLGKAVVPALVDTTQELDEGIILRVLGDPGLHFGHFGLAELIVVILVEHGAELAGGGAVQFLDIGLAVFAQCSSIGVGVAGAVHLDVVIFDKHAAAITVVHHQQTKAYAGYYDEYEKRVFTDEFECAHGENVIMRLFYAFPPALQARKPLRCVSMRLPLAGICATMPPDMAQSALRTVNVVAALILNDEKRVLAVKCADSKFDGGWEFPGGKIEPGESPQAALAREIAEELELHISVEQLVYTVEMDYPAFHLSMQCFACRLLSGTLQLHEHTDSRWLAADELDSVRWLPADVDVLPHLRALLSE